MLYNKEDLKKALQDNIIFFDENYDNIIDNFVLDSRDIKNNTLFIAKKGENNDGHNFIKDLIKNKTITIIAEYLPKGIEQNPRIILVKNTIEAMEQLAIYSRNRLNGYIIGITGSIGKTSTKEIFYHCLSKIDKTHCNNKSFNSYFGILDTLINTPSNTKFAIFEMGMNEYGEMDVLKNFIKPTITVITGIFPIHIGNFKKEEDIAIEKSKINDNNTITTILNKDNKWYDLLYKDAKNKNIKNIFTFGSNGDVELQNQEIKNSEAELTYLINNNTYKIKTLNLDKSMAINFSSLLCFAKSINLDINIISKAFYDYKTYDGRNNIEKIKNFTIINGVYNANIKSFISGLELMNNIYEHSNKTMAQKFILFRYFKGLSKPAVTPAGGFFRIIASEALFGSRYVHIVKAGSSYYFLASADNEVTLLEKIEDREMIQSIELYVSTMPTEPQTFHERLVGAIQKSKIRVSVDEAVGKISGQVKKQSDKFKKMEHFGSKCDIISPLGGIWARRFSFCWSFVCPFFQVLLFLRNPALI